MVSIRQLLALGVSRNAVESRERAGRLHRLHTGVYAVGHTHLTQRGRWMAAVLALGRGALLSHRDAAVLWGLRAPGGGRINVTVDGRSGRRPRPGIAVHRCRIHAEDRARLDGIPVTSVARTLLDLAGSVDATALRRAYEEAERLRLLDVRAIERLLARSNGRRGVGRLRALLDYDPSRAAQAYPGFERQFLDLVRDAGLPTPQVNVLVEGCLVDAYWPDARLVVELDSWGFHRTRGAFERDRRKAAALKLAGVEVIAVTHRQVTRDPVWVAEAVRALLRNRDRRAA